MSEQELPGRDSSSVSNLQPQEKVDSRKPENDGRADSPPLSSTGNMWIFGAFYGSIAIAQIVIYLGGIYFYYTWGLSITWELNAGMINFAVGKYTEAYIGYVSDRLDDKSKYGRRKPFIIIGYMLMAISVVLFSIKPGNDKMVVRLWFICMRVIYTIGSTMLTVSFSAWMIESTNDTADYTKIYAIAIPIGNLVLGSMGLGLLSMSFFCAAVLFFLVGGISTLLLCTRVPNVVRRISTAEPSLIPSLREAWRMNEFRILFVNTTLVLSMATLIFLFAGYILLTGFGIATLDRFGIISIMVIAFTNILSTVTMAVSNTVLKYVDKHKFYNGVLLSCVVLVALSSVISLSEDNLYPFMACLVIIGILALPINLCMALFLKDIVTYDVYMTGINRESMFYVAMKLPSSILYTMLSAIPIIFLYFTGFEELVDVDDDRVDGNYEYSDGSLWYLRIGLFSCSLVLCISLYLFKRFALTTHVADAMNTVVKIRARKICDEEDQDSNNADKATNANIIELANEPASTEDNLTSQEKHCLLHLAPEECNYLAHASSSRDQSGDASSAATCATRLHELLRRCEYLIAGSCVVMLVALLVIGFDVARTGTYVTLNLIFFLIGSFNAAYECLRWSALKDIQKLSPVAWINKSRKVYEESVKERVNLEDLLQRDGIELKPPQSSSAPEDDSFFDAILSPSRESSLCVPPVDSAEDPFGDAQISGFKRKCTIMVVVISVSLVVLLADIV